MNRPIKYLACLINLFFQFSVCYSQCPTESDFADGGTFNGNCAMSVGLNVTITGDVYWTGGTLNIQGGDGDLIIENGGSLTIASGDILVNDDGNTNGTPEGRIVVQAGGSLTVSSGTSITSHERIEVYGSLTVNGDMTSEDSHLIVGLSGIVNVNVAGNLITLGGGDSEVMGTINIYGLLDTSGDTEINGGTVHVYDGGSLEVGDASALPKEDEDLLVYNGGSLIVDSGGSIIVEDDIVGGDDPPPYTPSQATIIINGSITAGGDLIIFETTPDSILDGEGSITVDGSFTDSEEGIYHGCAGDGATCYPAALPVELIYFVANVEDKYVDITWRTAIEINNDFFIVQHSSDGINFETISKIKGKGTTNEMHEYKYKHQNPTLDANYYQLIQSDFDGSITNSEIILVDYKTSQSLINFFPNPISIGNELNLNITQLDGFSDSIEAIVFDCSGKIIKEIIFFRKSGSMYSSKLDDFHGNKSLIIKLKEYNFQSKVLIK